MIIRNWVLKRKRRKLPSGLDHSSGKDNSVTSESSRNASAKRPLNITLNAWSVILVATYCAVIVVLALIIYSVLTPLLSYLLMRMPMGKWQCPSCTQGNDQLKPINHLDSISKRARTKIVTAKSRSGVNSLDRDKVSQIFSSKHISKKRSSGIGKSISTLGVKHPEKKPLSSKLTQVTKSSVYEFNKAGGHVYEVLSHEDNTTAESLQVTIWNGFCFMVDRVLGCRVQDLNVVEYHGCAKARAIIRQYEWHASDPNKLNKRTAANKFNVLLTTYEMVLADSSHLRGVPWEVLVVDEGRRLKNSGSKLFSLLNAFSFHHRVLLTGTPLQNNIGEMLRRNLMILQPQRKLRN
ncbi:hypothetical protein L6164_031726 [Bauhinia variegata]|uniref:Uncharacterized protein n=1 Tax=Bauhinia variegata TaxID=167791 RepID=A0ACB9KLC8_BAUVA|nr:hypothetical protein L6164_031726 [Bauhinia variegata]